MVFDVIEINLIATNAHHCRGNQRHGQVLAGCITADHYRRDQADNADNNADVKKIAAENVAQTQVGIAVQGGVDIAELILTVNSGIEVPKATIVLPITRVGIL